VINQIQAFDAGDDPMLVHAKKTQAVMNEVTNQQNQ
jgi:hypothetical protein